MAKKLSYKLCPRCGLNYIEEKEDLCPVCKKQLQTGITDIDEDEEQDLCPICKVNYKPIDEEMCEECAAKKRDGEEIGDRSIEDVETNENEQGEYDNIDDDFDDEDEDKISLEEYQEEEEELENASDEEEE